VELCDEFLTRLRAAKLSANAMFPVYGLAEASLAVSFPPVGAPLRTLTLNGSMRGARWNGCASDAQRRCCHLRGQGILWVRIATMRTASCPRIRIVTCTGPVPPAPLPQHLQISVCNRSSASTGSWRAPWMRA